MEYKHWSDCAVHNAPAYPAGECNCGTGGSMKKVNAWLEGFRTILLALAGYAVLFVDVLFTNLSGLNNDALKGAAAMAILITLKQIKTDVIPKLKERLNK